MRRVLTFGLYLCIFGFCYAIQFRSTETHEVTIKPTVKQGTKRDRTILPNKAKEFPTLTQFNSHQTTKRVYDEIIATFGNGTVSPAYQAVFDCAFKKNLFTFHYRVGSKRENLFQKLKTYPNQSINTETLLSGDTSIVLTIKEWEELTTIINTNRADQKLNCKFDSRPMAGKSVSILTLKNKGKQVYYGPANNTVNAIESWVEQFIINH